MSILGGGRKRPLLPRIITGNVPPDPAANTLGTPVDYPVPNGSGVFLGFYMDTHAAGGELIQAQITTFTSDGQSHISLTGSSGTTLSSTDNYLVAINRDGLYITDFQVQTKSTIAGSLAVPAFTIVVIEN